MLLIATLAAALAAGGSSHDAPLQIFRGPSFDAFAAATDAACPGARARWVTAGDLAGWEEAFTDQLPKAQSARVVSAKRCERRNGLSCPASTTLDSISRAGLMDQFVAFVCSRAGR